MDNHSTVFYQLYRLIEFRVERDPGEDEFQLLPFIQRGKKMLQRVNVVQGIQVIGDKLGYQINSPILMFNKHISKRKFYFLEISKAFLKRKYPKTKIKGSS